MILVGCASIADPRAPSLMIPERVTDLTAVERGDSLVINFTAPSATTDGAVLRRFAAIELRAGDRTIPVETAAPGPVHVETPVAGLVGRDVEIAVRLAGRPNRFGAWSNAVKMRVLAPLVPPRDVTATAVAQGVRIAWHGEDRPGIRYRVFRGAGEVGATESDSWIDTHTEYGKPYAYTVEAFVPSGDTEAVSLRSAAVTITPIDTFAPAVPSGIVAAAGAGGVQLTWDPNGEPDLRGYYVYRSVDGGDFTRVGGLLELPHLTDPNVQAGKTYRYSVSALDENGNESARSAPADVTVPQ